jgi:hypothetical protein
MHDMRYIPVILQDNKQLDNGFVVLIFVNENGQRNIRCYIAHQRTDVRGNAVHQNHYQQTGGNDYNGRKRHHFISEDAFHGFGEIAV